MTVHTDDFAGTDGQLLDARPGWTRDGGTGTAEVSGNRLGGFGSTGNNAGYFAPDTGSANHYAKAQIWDASHTDFPLVVRMQDRNNFAAALRVNAGNSIVLVRRSAGNITTIDTISVTHVNGTEYELRADGGNAIVYQAGVQIGSYAISTFSTETKVGIVVRDATDNPLLDAWESGPNTIAAVMGAASVELPVTGTAAGVVRVAGAASASLPVSGTAAGVVRVAGAASASLPFSVAASGVIGNVATGSASVDLPFSGTAASAIRVAGAASANLPITVVAAGAVRVAGSAAVALPFAGEAAGSLGGAISGAAIVALPFSANASGAILLRGAAAVSLPIAFVAAGRVGEDVAPACPLPATPRSRPVPAAARTDPTPATRRACY